MPRVTARYGPPPRYPPAPAAGMCISAFAVVRRRGRVLAGLPRFGPRWRNEWLTSLASYTPEEQAAMEEEWRLPATYLLEGEHPEKALDRVMRSQLGAKKYAMKGLTVGSWAVKSDWYPGHKHWDLAFVYQVTAELPARVPRWWREMAWCTPAELRKMDFGWSTDLAREVAGSVRRL